MSLAEIAACTGGRVADGDPETVVSGPAGVDSRAVEHGGLFVAVAGERVDGHDYAGAAVAAGAAGCLVARPVGAPAVVVADPVAALGRLAAHVRSGLSGCTVVAITGSQGKTTTKDLLRQVLSGHGETVAPPGSYNNELGEHAARNAAAAAAVAIAAGIGLSDAAPALSAATATSRWRMEPYQRADGVLVLNDAYNANPDSMRAALNTFATIAARGGGRRTVAVLGEMLELGETSSQEHEAIGRLVARLGVSRLLVVGDAAGPLHSGASSDGSWQGESAMVADPDAATAWLRQHLRPDDVVLVKASRAVGLERVAAALSEPAGEEGR